MIFRFTKSTFLIISFSVFCISCEFGGLVKDQLALAMEMRKGFGGEWSIQLSEDCFTVEITNSARIINNPDSINYYGAMIGRKVINEVESPRSCMRLIVKSEQKLGVAYKSNSREYVYNLRLIELFKNKSISEHPKYITAAFAALSAAGEDMEYAVEKRALLDSMGFKKDYINLIDLLIKNKEGKKVNIQSFLANVSDKSDTELIHVAVESYKQLDELETTTQLIKLVLEKDPDNTIYMMMNGVYCFQNKAYKEAVALFSAVIKNEPENLRAWHSRAWANFKLGKTSEGCEDISQMYLIKPEVNMPDSTKVICKIN